MLYLQVMLQNLTRTAAAEAGADATHGSISSGVSYEQAA